MCATIAGFFPSQYMDFQYLGKMPVLANSLNRVYPCSGHCYSGDLAALPNLLNADLKKGIRVVTSRHVIIPGRKIIPWTA